MHTSYTIDPKIATRFSTLYIGHSLLPGRFQILISVRGSVYSGAMVLLEVVGTLKIPE
jgi:hypothetical protein